MARASVKAVFQRLCVGRARANPPNRQIPESPNPRVAKPRLRCPVPRPTETMFAYDKEGGKTNLLDESDSGTQDDVKRYLVNLSPESHVEFRPSALLASEEEVAELLCFMRESVAPTPNPRNPKYFLHRKQCTFASQGAREYEFGQYNQHFFTPRNEWPAIVRKALQLAHQFSDQPELYNGVHVNLYEDGSVGLAPHRDNEGSMVRGMPIFSFTVLEDPATPREFVIYDNDKVTRRLSVHLGHGDLLIMKGKVQEQFTHGVPKTKRPRSFRPRINLTVRAFSQEMPPSSSISGNE